MKRFLTGALLLFLAQGTFATTVTSLGATFNTTAGNKTVTATPAVNDLIVVIAAASGTSEANASTTSVSDNNSSGAYTKIAESAAGSSPRISIWIRTTFVGSATSTIFTATQASSSGGGLEVLKATSMQRVGAQAARGFGSNFNASSGTPSVALQQAALTGNGIVGGVTNSTSPGGVTQPASWTSSQNLGYSTPTTGLSTSFRSSGETSTTITWGGTSASAWRAAVVELDTSAPPTCAGTRLMVGVGC